MINWLFKGQSATFRIAMGMSGGVVSLLLVASIIGLLPDSRSIEDEGRARLAEVLAINSSLFITLSDLHRLESTLKIAVDRNDDILSAGVRKANGRSIITVGEHEANWNTVDPTAPGQMRVPILEGNVSWGHLEIQFAPHGPDGWIAYFYHPMVHLMTFVGVVGFALCYFYLRSMLKQLDPSQAVPGRVRSALDTMAEGLLVLDARQNIMLANKAFAKVVDQEPEDLVGQRAMNFPWTDDKDNPLEAKDTPWGQSLATATALLSRRVKLFLDEEHHWTFMVNCSPVLSDNGKAGGILVSFDDVTELELKEIELQKSIEEAEAANRSKSEFLANMSHEIRSPMNAILGFTEILRRGYSKNKQESTRYLNTISESGEHLLSLINDILDISKVEAGRIELEIAECEPHRIIREVTQIMQVTAEERGLTLTFQPDGPLPSIIQTDSGKLRQIILNLVSNALKFTPEGDVVIHSSFISDGDQSRLKLDVTDTGIGMTEEQVGKVFESFVQADSSITRRFGGTGLGLAISKSYAEALGGDLLVTSQYANGSTFTLTIATGEVDQQSMLTEEQLLADDTHAQADEHQEWTFPAARILVVDDGKENCTLLKLVLEEAGLSVETASNGAEALQRVSAKEFAMVLMDVQMPVMDGYTAVKKMRELGLTIPVMALTAHAMKGVKEQCLDAGYTSYLAKPIDIENLLRSLASELGGTAKRSADIVVPSDDVESDVKSEESDAITSRLAGTSEKMQSLVESFVVTLGEKMDLMEAALDAHEPEKLAVLAHWLKGSAGSLGFHDFTLPARALELACDGNGDMNEVFAQLRDLQARISTKGTGSGRAPPARLQAAPTKDPGEGSLAKEDATEVTRAPQKASYFASAEQDRSHFATDPAGSNSDSPQAVRSDLPTHKPKFHDLVSRFVFHLGKQIVKMKQAADEGDHESLAALGHWLKGSGGSVGFNEFYEPGICLEESGKEQRIDDAVAAIVTIDELYQRIYVPPLEDLQRQAQEML